MGTGIMNELASLPILGICGASGSGKTTLIEALIPRFLADGLRVAVIKDGAHRVVVDAPGKDSDRFFRAGADVALCGQEQFLRSHSGGEFPHRARELGQRYDLVLVEGHASTPIQKIWLLGSGHDRPPAHAGEILSLFTQAERKPDTLHAWICDWLSGQWHRKPLYGCILIGGKSSRMGQPKHLIRENGQTWLELAVQRLSPLVDQVVLSGRGQVPDCLAHLPRLADVPGIAGPMTGLLSAMRWQPEAAWILLACDQPDFSAEAVSWLRRQAMPGVYAVLPDLAGSGHQEPLLAWYDSRCRFALEELARQGCLRLSGLAGQPGVISPTPPAHLCPCWRNVNTPQELACQKERN